MSLACRVRARACISATVCAMPPFMCARTCTASLPELRKTPRHRSSTRYGRFSLTPTRLLPAPRLASSAGVTWCSSERSNLGSTVSANSILRVLAGGSCRWALRAASTSPVVASATSQERPDSSDGRAGAPASGATWTFGLASRSPPTGPAASCSRAARAIGAPTASTRAEAAAPAAALAADGGFCCMRLGGTRRTYPGRRRAAVPAAPSGGGRGAVGAHDFGGTRSRRKSDVRAVADS